MQFALLGILGHYVPNVGRFAAFGMDADDIKPLPWSSFARPETRALSEWVAR